MAEHEYCSRDDCPCFRAGEQSMFDDVIDKAVDVVTAARALIEAVTVFSPLAGEAERG